MSKSSVISDLVLIEKYPDPFTNNGLTYLIIDILKHSQQDIYGWIAISRPS